MILSNKLLTLVGALVMATYQSEVVTGSDEVDEETSLKQALFLVGLLKSDFSKFLREKGNSTDDDVNGNFTEDANTTCTLPPEDFNSTVAINETVATESVTAMSSASEASTTTLPNFLTPGAPPVLQFSSWPPLPMPGYLPPQGLIRPRNFPDDYRFPYRFNRRRMMPDYYYYDSPVQRRGNLRRQNIPNDDLGVNTATTQAQTTFNKPSTPREATTLHVEEATPTSTTLSTITQLSASNLPTTPPFTTTSTIEPSFVSTIGPSTLPIVELSSLTVEPSTLLTTEAKTLSTSEETTETSTLTVTESSILLTKPRNRIGVRMPAVSFEEAKTTVISYRNEKVRLKNTGHLLRQHKSTSEKYPSEDIEMSQVASELVKEFKGTKTENITNILDQVTKDSKQNLKKKHRTSMKIYLKGSSRLPVPLPENNAFCHSYPHNALCGTM